MTARQYEGTPDYAPHSAALALLQDIASGIAMLAFVAAVAVVLAAI